MHVSSIQGHEQQLFSCTQWAAIRFFFFLGQQRHHWSNKV